MSEANTQLKTKQAKAFLAKYQNDPIGFQCDILDTKREHVWPKMVEMAESVRDYQKTCVFAGHGVSKTYELGRIALWFLYTHKPSTVITTAPIYDQVEKLLWKEMHTAHSQAKIPLGGKMTKTQLDIDEDQKWFAYGFSTKADTVTGEATRMQGYHNKYVLIIFDEAAGIPAAIWKASESLLTSQTCKIIAVGNPTSSFGSFAECEDNPDWHFIRISVKDSANFIAGEDIIPEISGRSYEKMIREKYGEESNEYAIRVLGRKPEYSMGTYLGKWMSDADKQGRIGSIVHEETAKVYTFWDPGDVYTAIWFVQFIKEQIRLVDFYYDCEGKGMAAQINMIKDKPYIYGDHFAPHDLWGSNAKKQGEYTVDIARSLGVEFNKVPLVSVNDRIEAAKGIVPKCWFAPACGDGVSALQNWRKRKNDALSTPDKPVYFEEPVKDWTRHVGDAFSYLAVAYRYFEIDGTVKGSIEPVITNIFYGSPYDNNILGRGMKSKIMQRN